VPQLDNSTSTSPSRTTSRSSPVSTAPPTFARRSSAARPLQTHRAPRRCGRQALGECAAGCCSPAALSTTRSCCLLDEPTVGLTRNPPGAVVADRRLRGQGKTILMSTHYIEEAERLADGGRVMSDGKIIARDKPRNLIAAHAVSGRPRSTGRPSASPRCAPGPRAKGSVSAPPAPRSRSWASRPRRRVLPEDAVFRAATLETSL